MGEAEEWDGEGSRIGPFESSGWARKESDEGGGGGGDRCSGLGAGRGSFSSNGFETRHACVPTRRVVRSLD